MRDMMSVMGVPAIPAVMRKKIGVALSSCVLVLGLFIPQAFSYVIPPEIQSVVENADSYTQVTITVKFSYNPWGAIAYVDYGKSKGALTRSESQTIAGYPFEGQFKFVLTGLEELRNYYYNLTMKDHNGPPGGKTVTHEGEFVTNTSPYPS